jgi:hypothetical protein
MECKPTATKQEVIKMLTNNSKYEAAVLLGITRPTLDNWIAHYQIFKVWS